MYRRSSSGPSYRTIKLGWELRPFPVYRKDEVVLTPREALEEIKKGTPLTEESFPSYYIPPCPEGWDDVEPPGQNEWVMLHVREMFPPDCEITFSQSPYSQEQGFVDGLPLVRVYRLSRTEKTENYHKPPSSRHVPSEDERLPWKYQEGSVLS